MTFFLNISCLLLTFFGGRGRACFIQAQPPPPTATSPITAAASASVKRRALRSSCAWTRASAASTADAWARSSTDVRCASIASATTPALRGRATLAATSGFYVLRHSFRTLADDSRDQHAICRIMGHALPGMAGPYVEEISVERLRAVTEHVRAKILARV